MKKKLLLPVFALMAGLLVSCGGGETPTESESGKAPTSSKTADKSSSKDDHVHTFDETKWEYNATNHWHPATCEHTTQKGASAAHTLVEDATKSVAADCSKEGKKVEKCSVCGYVKETTIAKTAHAWGAAGEEAGRAEGKVGYKIRECATCHKKDLFWNALDANATISGTNKDKTNATLKFSSNGEYAEYTIAIPTAMTNATVAVYGWVDYWKDGSNNNDQRGFYSRKSGEGTNVEVKLNDTAMEITNHKTYEEMGMTEGVDGNGSFTLCELGTVASIATGDLKLTYTRTESYNLNISEIHLLY